ncbi:hypothetical protein [Algoriphagus sp. A40]|uniref:hypothetical protein n=1 Tax=Algoriphagus sp. A40 TaxID=1945863 RepID=UPI00098720A3|nr:hypothetical protein [Algoriphagus sp. A40]OOG77871.1 hypothetical protein B0E43_03670 [Algoriphagus sp. A40]
MNDADFKAFVIPFYRSLLGFWILVLVFGGVFMELKQHILLGKFLFEHTLPFSLLPLGFLAYSGFHLRFQMAILRRKEYQVFHQTALIPFRDFAKKWAVIILANHFILIAYLVFLSYFGIEKQAWTPLLLLWAVVGFSLALPILLIYRYLGKPLKEAVLIRPRWEGKLPRITWFPLELRQNRPILLLLTKGLSLLLLNGFFLSFRSGNYDHRWLEFGILCVSFFHIPILLEKNEFENSRMAWFRNLPSPFLPKLLTHLGTLVLILFPELLFLFWKVLPLFAPDRLISLPLLLISGVIALLALIYRYPDRYFYRVAFGSFFGCFLVLLFGVPWIFPVLAFVIFFGFQIRSPFQL